MLGDFFNLLKQYRNLFYRMTHLIILSARNWGMIQDIMRSTKLNVHLECCVRNTTIVLDWGRANGLNDWIIIFIFGLQIRLVDFEKNNAFTVGTLWYCSVTRKMAFTYLTHVNVITVKTKIRVTFSARVESLFVNA